MNPLLRAPIYLVGALGVAGIVASYHSTSGFQQGFRGMGMEVVETKDRLADRVAANVVPDPLPPATPGGPLAVNAYKNVQVLGHASAADFTRLMTAITTWVAPEQGCGYCHAPQRDAAGKVVVNEDGYPQADLANMGSDELYTKRVARRMIQMTMRINGEWNVHVQKTGVTCYTCHRGAPVPVNIWFDDPPNENEGKMLGNRGSQNAPSTVAALASLPNDSLRPFLGGDEQIRVQSTEAVGSDNRASIKQTEWTYSLMMHMSKSLGVNCTYCHNTRSMGAWGASPATRTTAWYGIRMVRELNRDYLEGLLGTFPAIRLGPTGDVAKVNCATCHNGAFKPLLGQSMLTDYPLLAAAKPQPAKTSQLATTTELTGDGGVPPTAIPNQNDLSVTPVDGGTAPGIGPDGGIAPRTDAGAPRKR